MAKTMRTTASTKNGDDDGNDADDNGDDDDDDGDDGDMTKDDAIDDDTAGAAQAMKLLRATRARAVRF